MTRHRLDGNAMAAGTRKLLADLSRAKVVFQMRADAAVVDARPARKTARQILEARLGRRLPSVRDMPADMRRAMLLLGRELARPVGAAKQIERGNE